jgi:hypothetical protein
MLGQEESKDQGVDATFLLQKYTCSLFGDICHDMGCHVPLITVLKKQI